MLSPMVFGSTSKSLLLFAPVVLALALISSPTQSAEESLRQSEHQLRRFPFRPDCDGNTQQIVACLWRQRNQDDARLQHLLGSSALLEQWRTSRRQVCERAAAKAEGGSIHPIAWLNCENTLNAALIKEIKQSLAP